MRCIRHSVVPSSLVFFRNRIEAVVVDYKKTSREKHNPYAAPRARLTNHTGSSLEWDPFTKQCAEKMFRWRLAVAIATYFTYAIVNSAAFYPIQILFGEEPMIHLNPIGFLVLAGVYAALSGILVGLGSKIAVYFHSRNSNLQDFVTKWKKTLRQRFHGATVQTLSYVFIGASVGHSTVLLLASAYTRFTILATIVAFPVVAALCYPLCRVSIRRTFRLLDALSSGDMQPESD